MLNRIQSDGTENAHLSTPFGGKKINSKSLGKNTIIIVKGYYSLKPKGGNETMDLYNEMYERREKLADQMKDLQEKLIRLPAEDLHVQKDRGNTRWALSGEDEKGKHYRRYLSKTQEEKLSPMR